ncbi:uncharacterized protein [Aristolochia californica]|uniref:uncharacterized protein isoform X2 n=1 Tax=Aristolochia californica TaxID=171875 RepID=UPI0035DE7B80
MVDRRGFFFFTATSFSFGFKRTRVRVRVLNLVSYFLMDLITLHSSLFPLEWLNNLVDAREGMCWEKFVRRIGSTSIKGNSKLGSCLVEVREMACTGRNLFVGLEVPVLRVRPNWVLVWVEDGYVFGEKFGWLHRRHFVYPFHILSSVPGLPMSPD